MIKHFVTILLLTVLTMPATADDSKVLGAAMKRFPWICTQQRGWVLGDKPLWVSQGHLARVFCFIPEKDKAGKVNAVRLESHQVVTFADDGVTPATTTKLAVLRIDANDPERLKTRKRWGFPSEMSYNWEMEKIPLKEHQVLERIFLHKDPQIWQTLMIHSEAALVDSGGKKVFKTFHVHILFFDLLRGSEADLISTYIEKDDPPVRDWIAKRKIKAPWALGKQKLEHVAGELTVDGEKLKFGRGKPSTWKGWPKKTAYRPKLSDDALDDSKKDDDDLDLVED